MQSLTGSGDVQIKWGERSGGLQMGAAVETLGFLLWRKRQVVSIFIRNNGTQTESFLETNPAVDFRLSLTHPDGHVELSRRPEQEGDVFRNCLVELRAGEIYESRISLSEWFDVGKSGLYKLKVERSFAGRTSLSTPEITFHIYNLHR